jgi:hypothetical protein
VSARWRKLIGLVVGLVGLVVYALAAVLLGGWIGRFSYGAELVWYVIAGVLWVPPAGRLVRWMQALDPALTTFGRKPRRRRR